MKFPREYYFRDADLRKYEERKRLRTIRQESLPLDDSLDFPNLPQNLFGDDTILPRWQQYYGPRILMAAKGTRAPHLTHFPGHTIPGLGKGEKYLGALAIERFYHLLSLAGGLPPIGPFTDRYHKPEHKVEDLPLGEWPWTAIEQPRLKVIIPDRDDYVATSEEKELLLEWLRKMVEMYLSHQPPQVIELLQLISSAWGRYARFYQYHPEIINPAYHIVEQFLSKVGNGQRDWLSFAFELEASIRQIERTWPLKIATFGKYSGYWLETGSVHKSQLRCTERVYTKRVLDELISMKTDGIAPFVINEYAHLIETGRGYKLHCHMITDGNHRFVASEIWRLLIKAKREGIENFDPGNEVFQMAIAKNLHDSFPVIFHESLRVLAELLTDKETKKVMEKEIFPYLSSSSVSHYLPVVFLSEYSWITVFKDSYDQGTGAYRLDPTVYARLSSNPSLVLPARGPYHLTDRCLLPYFEIFEKT